MKHTILKFTVLTCFIAVQQIFAQTGTWSALGRNFSFKTVSEQNAAAVPDSDLVKTEIYSFSGLVENPDLTQKKPAAVKTVLFKDIHEKIGAQVPLGFKKNSVYVLRLNEGIRGERFRLDIIKNADPKKVAELNRYLTGKISHGGIMTESIDTKEKKNIATSFIIAVTEEDRFDFEALKGRFGTLISGISKVAAYKSTLFIKITT